MGSSQYRTIRIKSFKSCVSLSNHPRGSCSVVFYRRFVQQGPGKLLRIPVVPERTVFPGGRFDIPPVGRNLKITFNMGR